MKSILLSRLLILTSLFSVINISAEEYLSGLRRITISSDTPAQSLFRLESTIYEIKGCVDLHGKAFTIPQNCVISLEDGSLVNGQLIGNKTSLKSIKDQSIGVKLSGTWSISRIQDSYFAFDFLSDNDVMSNINYLMDDKSEQTIVLTKTKYCCDIPKNDGCLLALKNNTRLELTSLISINGNDFTSYNIIRVKGKENVSITGGALQGDVGKHRYVLNNSSQWGHGINIHSSKNVQVSDIVITHCIGDGIAVSGGKERFIGDYSVASQNVTLTNVTARYNRRQGLSIIHASDVIVRDCVFSDTGQIEMHSPSAGIDIEPNVAEPYYQAVRNVQVLGCSLERNVGYGILSNHYVNNNGVKSIEGVMFTDCYTDSQVVLYTGGINFDNTEMRQLSIIAEKAPIIGTAFTSCSIKGGNGIQFYCPNSGRDLTTMVGSITFNNCDISSAEHVNIVSSRGLLWCKGKASRMKDVCFRNCRLTIPLVASSSYNLLGSDDTTVEFDNCRISIPGRRFPINNVRWSDCHIVSRNLNE